MKLVLPLLALAMVVALLALAGCGPKPDPRIVTHEVTVPVPVPCKDTRLPAPDYRDTDAELKALPNSVERAKRIKEANVLLHERTTEDDKLIAVCSAP